MGLTVVAMLAGVASFGVGSYWLSTQPSATSPLEPLPAVTTDEAGPEKESAPSRADVSLTAGPVTSLKAAPPAPPPHAVASAQQAAAAPRTRVQPKAVRPPTPSTEIAPVSAPSLASAAPSPAVLEAPPPAAAPTLVDEAAALPRAPFFAPTDVTESPRVATRVEPQLPEDFRNRPINDVVVVRLLVSQTGHPSRVSLLRRSKGGLSIDDAVVAAVNKWTFSPARKKGEAVSCWYNLGVPIPSAE